MKRIFPQHIITAALILSFSALAADVQSKHWRWSNPLPHGNNVMDMHVSPDFILQVGDAGTLYINRQDGHWNLVDTKTDLYLRSVTMLGERIIATGENGTILWSDDGITFEPAELSPANTLDWFEGVTASSSRAVAVGDYGAIYTSTNGIQWSQSTSGTTEWLRGVSFGNDTFITVGENGTLLTSINGIAWAPIASGTTEHLNRVRYTGSGNNEQFIAVGNAGTAIFSPTGSAPWTSLNCGSTNNLNDAAVNQIGTLLVGDQEIRTQSFGSSVWINQVDLLITNAPPAWTYLSAYGNANTWLVAGRTGQLIEGTFDADAYRWKTSPSDSSHAWLWDMTLQNGIYIAVGDLANIQTSLDGILWSKEVVPDSHTNTVLLGVGGTSNLLIAAGNDGHVLWSESELRDIAITNDVGMTNITVDTFGVVWNSQPNFTTSNLQGVDAGNGIFMLSGEGGKIFTSPNGTNWTERTTPTTAFLSSIAIGNETSIAVGENGTLLYSTTDGASWTAVATGTTNWLYRARWIDNQFIVVGENGRIMTSTNGTTWNVPDSGTTRWLTDITKLEDAWYISGYQGTLLSSPDLTTWMKQSIPTVKSLFGAAAQNGQLILSGVEGVILRNQIKPDLTPVEILNYKYSLIPAATSDAADSIYELFLLGGQPDQVFELHSSTNLVENLWVTNAVLEVYDASGTLYLIRSRDANDAPSEEFYRTPLIP